MAWLFKDPITLSDGTIIKPTKFERPEASESGYSNVGYDGGKYIAFVTRQQAREIDRRLDNAQPGNGGFFLGRFSDPRVAAYVAANFIQNPPARDFIDSYLSTSVKTFGRDGLASMFKTGKNKNIDIPEDVYELPLTPGTEELFKRKAEEEKQKAEISANKKRKMRSGADEAERLSSPARTGFYQKYEGKLGFDILKGLMNHFNISKDAITRLLDTLTTNEFELRFGSSEGNHDLSHFKDEAYQTPSKQPEANRGKLSESTRSMIRSIEQEILAESSLSRILMLSGVNKD